MVAGRVSSIMRTLAWPVLLPLTLLLALTLVFRLSDADLLICRLSYQGPQNPWPWAHVWICDWIYSYGTLPGLALGIGGLTIAVASLIWSRLRPYRKYGWFLAAVLALGPGLLVNGILKPQWGRPRPHQTVAFGGEHAFVGVWGMSPSSLGKSFPSGHASMGFYLIAPAFFLYRRRRRLAQAFILMGLIGGLALGVTRILQGSHFPSDVLWSAGFVYLTSLGLAAAFGLLRRREATVSGRDAVRVVAAPEQVGTTEHVPDVSVAADEDTTRRNAA
jgi:membrane-associated PAP2 superfamily phosphatase